MIRLAAAAALLAALLAACQPQPAKPGAPDLDRTVPAPPELTIHL